jgi:peptidoglycan/LPS O-acetylase OafA/YrhL
VLSGRLLAGQYLAAIIREQRLPSTKAFYLKRFLRIYPLYAVGILIGAIVELLLHGGFAFAYVAGHLVFAQGFSLAFQDDPINIPLWTMTIDAEFYLVLPLIAAVVARMVLGATQRRKVTVIVATLVLVAVVSIAYRYLAFALFPGALESFSLLVIVVRNIVGMASAFAFGTLLALMEVLGVRPRLRFGVLASVVGFIAFVGIVSVKSSGHALHAKVWADLVAAFSTAAVLYALSAIRAPRFTAIIHSNAITALATLAYGVYLVHAPILRVFSTAFVVRLGTAPRGSVGYCILLGIVCAVVTIAVAFVLNRYVEQPFLRIKSRVSNAS